MIRSRLLFLLLLLAYLGVTPAGVYTCACILSSESASAAQPGWGDFSEQTPLNDTAVASFLTYFSLTFLMAAVLSLGLRFKFHFICLPAWQQPDEFTEPPPTPPPHFA